MQCLSESSLVVIQINYIPSDHLISSKQLPWESLSALPGIVQQVNCIVLHCAEVQGERIKRTDGGKKSWLFFYRTVMDFSPIKTHVQERPCNTLIGICDADHCRPQDVRDYPKSSDWSRLPEGKKTQALLIQEKTFFVPESCCASSFGEALFIAFYLSQTHVTKQRTTLLESCKIMILIPCRLTESDVTRQKVIHPERGSTHTTWLWIRS